MIRVELASTARAQAERIAELFRDELADVLVRLGVTPLLGTPYEWGGPFVVRRVLLPRSRYCVYCSFDDAMSLVKVRAIWHTSRGRDPSIK